MKTPAPSSSQIDLSAEKYELSRAEASLAYDTSDPRRIKRHADAQAALIAAKTPTPTSAQAQHSPLALPLKCVCSHFVATGKGRPEAHHVAIADAENAVIFPSILQSRAALIVQAVNERAGLVAALAEWLAADDAYSVDSLSSPKLRACAAAKEQARAALSAAQGKERAP